jgi:uncharacterized membrane protein
METKLKVLGHPVHPMLVVFPLGLLSTAVVFDLLYLATANEELATFAFWAIAAGVVGGLLAAIFGLWDWLGIPRETRAKRVGLVHGAGNAIVTGLFAVSWLPRTGDPTYLPGNVLPLLLALVGAAIALFTAWLGGELVYRLRVGVDDDAGLNATSSLSASGIAEADRPA